MRLLVIYGPAETGRPLAAIERVAALQASYGGELRHPSDLTRALMDRGQSSVVAEIDAMDAPAAFRHLKRLAAIQPSGLKVVHTVLLPSPGLVECNYSARWWSNYLRT